MLYWVAQIQLSMLLPLFSESNLPLTPSTSHSPTHKHTRAHTYTQNAQADSPATFVLTLKFLQRDIHTQSPIPYNPSSHPTNSAVLSVPTRTAFTFPILASAVFIAARVTRPLVTPRAHPAVITAAAARYTNAMTTTVGCTNLCGRRGHRKRQKRTWGKQAERKGGWSWDDIRREGSNSKRQQEWRKEESKTYCQGKTATLQ